MGKYTVQEAIDILEKDSLIYNDEAWQTLKAEVEQRADNNASAPCVHEFYAYEDTVRCVKCGIVCFRTYEAQRT